MDHIELAELIEEKAKHFKIYLTLATNSIKLGFYTADEKNADFYLWIGPSWRITRNDSTVINSHDYPYHQNYTEDEREKERQDFQTWASQADDLRKHLIIEKVEISPKSDLFIKFSSDYELDVFVNGKDEYSWYFKDNMRGMFFEASIGRIEERAQALDED